MLSPKYTHDVSGEHAPTYWERKPWLARPSENIFSYTARTVGMALRGQPLTWEQVLISLITSLSVAALAVPLAVQGGFMAYEEAKRRGYIK